MAIYSLNLASIGRSTHAAGTAGAHLLYIGRQSAQPEIAAAHMPADPQEARTYVNQAEAADRKNARVIDKVRIALPRELDGAQRMAVIQSFAGEITQGRVPWYAAIHQSGKDAHNPHCHLVLRDRDIETGKRVLRLSDSARDRQKAGLEPKAVEWMRERWEYHANLALERAGHEARIDRRSLEAQGIEREPTIHIGPQAQHIDREVQRPQSKQVIDGRGRTIDYELIDAGRTRRERHAEIVDLNLERDARSPDFETRERAKFLRDQIARDRVLENRLNAEARQRTLQERRLAGGLSEALKEARENARAEMEATRAQIRADWQAKRESVGNRHQFEQSALDAEQSRFLSKLWRSVDITGRARKAQNAARDGLAFRQREERKRLIAEYQKTKAALLEAVKVRAQDIAREIERDHDRDTAEKRERLEQARQDADRQRQNRVAEREQQTQRFEATLRQVKQQRRERDRSQERSRDRGPELGR